MTVSMRLFGILSLVAWNCQGMICSDLLEEAIKIRSASFIVSQAVQLADRRGQALDLPRANRAPIRKVFLKEGCCSAQPPLRCDVVGLRRIKEHRRRRSRTHRACRCVRNPALHGSQQRTRPWEETIMMAPTLCTRLGLGDDVWHVVLRCASWLSRQHESKATCATFQHDLRGENKLRFNSIP